jgi:hypothetical protein
MTRSRCKMGSKSSTRFVRDGKGGIASGGANAPRNFCDAAFQTSRTDDDLKCTIRMGKGAMPAFGNLFSDTDLQGLVHKLRTFDPKGR